MQPLMQPQPFSIPSLHSTLYRPPETCAVCFFTSVASEEHFSNSGYSIPFTVLQEQRIPHYRFSAQHPSGVADPGIVSTATGPAERVRPKDKTEEGRNKNVDSRLIVGIVLGVLGGAAFAALGCWILWRRGGGERGKEMNSTDGSLQEAELRTLHGVNGDSAVERRKDSRESQAPPAYHEAIRDGQPQRYM